MGEQYVSRPSTGPQRSAPTKQQLQLVAATAQMPAELVQLTWNTVASQARNMNDFLLFLMFCRENQVNPLRGEATMQLRFDKSINAMKPVFVVSYQVIIRRALKAGYLICPTAVHAKDEFAFDAGALTVKHRFGADRGPCIGAYALAKSKATGKTVAAMYLPIGELRQSTPIWATIEGTMAMKTVGERLARYVVEELSQVHGAEEMGVEIPKPVASASMPSIESTFGESTVEEEAKSDTQLSIEAFLMDEDEYRSRISNEIAKRKCAKHGAAEIRNLTEEQLKELLADLVERFDKAPPQAATAPAAKLEEKPASEGAPEPAPRQRPLIAEERVTAEEPRIVPKEIVGLGPLDPFAGKVEKRNDEWLESYYHVKKLAKANAVNTASVTSFLEKKKFRWVAQLTTDQISELIAILERAVE